MNSYTQDNFLLFGQFYPLEMEFSSTVQSVNALKKLKQPVDANNNNSRIFVRRNAIYSLENLFNKSNKSELLVLQALAEEEAKRQIENEARVNASFY